MRGREQLQPWIIDALRSNGGQATITEVAKYVWQNHEHDLRASDELLYKWQYELRWAAGRLRHSKLMKSASVSPKGIWVLASN